MFFNQGKKWSKDDLDKLQLWAANNKPLDEIIKEFGRTETAILAKIESLNIPYGQELVKLDEPALEYLDKELDNLSKHFNIDSKSLFFNINKLKLKKPLKIVEEIGAKLAADMNIIDGDDRRNIEEINDFPTEDLLLPPAKIEIIHMAQPLSQPLSQPQPQPQEPKEIILTEKQQMAFEQFKKGESMCITGPAGTGKSFLINTIKEYCIENNIKYAITALTGVAATIINGSTLHRWSGLGLINKEVKIMAAIIKSKPPLLKQWREIKTLIIDEVSMMTIDIFEKLNKVAKNVRGNESFFGGIQLILCGDFAQLGPISNPHFIFECKIWANNIQKNIIYLDEIMRQKEDDVFIKLLSEVRLGIISDETKDILNSRLISNNRELEIELENNIIEPTKLFPKKIQVEEINLKKLKALIDNKCEYNMYESLDYAYDLKSKITKKATEDQVQFINDRCPKNITLSVNCQVMLICNLDPTRGLINGSRGIITEFIENYPVVLFDNGIKIRVSCYLFEQETNTHKITRKQVPLILAWAITIHKCQGSTITKVITDLQDIFCDAQGYVTLSRVKSLSGLYLININYNKITCNPLVKEFYDCLKYNLKFTHILDNSEDNMSDIEECLL